MNLKAFWVVHKAKKALKALLADFRLYEDILPEATREALLERFADLRQAIACGEIEDLPVVIETLHTEMKAAFPSTYGKWQVEWFDIIVSALAVAFCFRAYFYEPFQIPTGSMQPTLYGITGEDCVQSTMWDAAPLSFLKWCVTGESYDEVVIERAGRIVDWRHDRKPGYASLIVRVGQEKDTYHIPSNVATPEWILKKRLEAPVRDADGTVIYDPKRYVAAGQPIWRGYVRSGDFVFVNRWIWNFRHPRVGETIVFSTQGVHPKLAENTHYIKRLCGKPGDTVELKPDSSYLWINGEKVTSPKRMLEIATHELPWTGAPRYLGYHPAKPDERDWPNPFSTFDLGTGEYLALGDNSGNSLDSRYWGKVPSRNLLGPASFVHWPFTSPRWGSIR